MSHATKSIVAAGLLVCAVVLGGAFPRGAAANALLGSARSFAILGSSTVTNTGATVITGNLGLYPGTAVTGFPPGTVNGTMHVADAVALQARSDVTAAYIDLAGRACDFDLTGQDLGGMTLIPGVYCFSSTAQLTGTLTLDALGDPDALFIFQIGSSLTTASGSSVLMTSGSPCNVFWQVGSSATIGTTTSFVGNILALTSIWLTNGASIEGRALARNGEVTMDTNTVSNAACITVEIPTATPTATVETPTSTTGPGESTPVGTAPGDETPTVTGESTPVTGTPSTGTPVSGTQTPIIPGNETPGAGTPTITVQQEGTPTITVQQEGTPTSTPLTQTPGGPTATPRFTTPVTGTPTAWATSTPTKTATAPIVTFPKTGSGGQDALLTSQSVGYTNLAISLALVLLLTGALAFTIERRSRR
ncbi:MAG TPA: ice-binding family protein [Thermomicrobiales bacterium]|nr:ice-binding family protein [Thermomicrobiales bacterium]